MDIAMQIVYYSDPEFPVVIPTLMISFSPS